MSTAGRQKRPFIKGWIGWGEGASISGWIFNTQRPTEQLQVVIEVGGKKVGPFKANALRPHLRDRGIGDGRFGFRVDVDEKVWKRRAGTLRMWPVRYPDQIVEGTKAALPVDGDLQADVVLARIEEAERVSAPKPTPGAMLADEHELPIVPPALTSEHFAPTGLVANGVSAEIEAPSFKPPRATEGDALKGLRGIRRQVLEFEKGALTQLRSIIRSASDDAGFDQPFGERIRALDAFVEGAVRNMKDDLAKIETVVKSTPERPAELIAKSQELQALLEYFLTLYPATPYYSRLRQAIQRATSFSNLSQIMRTLTLVDQRRQGQLPRSAGQLISVIMPAYNRSGLIGDAIRSVLTQSFTNFELIICDDASTDTTVKVIQSFKDSRIHLLKQPKQLGAAAARNRCLEAAKGSLVAYLDSDNIWHPRFLELMAETLATWPGQLSAYAGYFDLSINKNSDVVIRDASLNSFYLEDQIEKPFIDLNSFVHDRRLYEALGGFDERLQRRQDYDLISRYCWSREPQSVPYVMNLYQRLENENQITKIQKNNVESPALVRKKIDEYYVNGLPVHLPKWLKKVSVLSWDMSRNHFAKAFCVADALSKHIDVELISYRFFEEDVFQPLADVKPSFETKYYDGGTFPDFFDNFAKGVDSITGDAIYAVKPRLTSFGIGLLANYHTGKPLMLECNDLETVVGSPKAQDSHAEKSLRSILDQIDSAAVPHDLLWSQVLDPLVSEIPVVFTHNINLNLHYDRRCLYMRNIKDDSLYDPSKYEREKIRAELGFTPQDRVILFGGLVRKHKGIFELTELLDRLQDPRYKLLVVGSRETPDLKKLSQSQRNNVVLLPPQPPERMAAINYASDLVVLWFDPNVPAGQYQSPYKMSDALAMGPAIITSPTSDLAEFASRNLVWNVPFGDREQLVSTIKRVLDDPTELQRRRNRNRALFQREFSYKSVLPCFALGASGLEQDKVYPVSIEFAELFAEFEKRVRAGKS